MLKYYPQFPLSAAGGSAFGGSSVPARGGPACGWGRKTMACVYVLRSKRNNKRYVGCTSRDVQERFAEHNNGSSQWTSLNGPFELVYVQEYCDIKEAKELEKFLKSGQGRQCLDEFGI